MSLTDKWFWNIWEDIKLMNLNGENKPEWEIFKITKYQWLGCWNTWKQISRLSPERITALPDFFMTWKTPNELLGQPSICQHRNRKLAARAASGLTVTWEWYFLSLTIKWIIKWNIIWLGKMNTLVTIKVVLYEYNHILLICLCYIRTDTINIGYNPKYI